MGTREQPLTPLAAVAGGLLAGAVGTAAMDAVLYARYRRAGGKDAPLAWEFPPTESWQQASDPGQVVKRGALAFECRKCWHLAQVDEGPKLTHGRQWFSCWPSLASS